MMYYSNHLFILHLRDSSGIWEYYMAFNINDRDATGQTILYLSSLLGNKKLLDAILNFKLRATRVESVTNSLFILIST